MNEEDLLLKETDVQYVCWWKAGCWTEEASRWYLGYGCQYLGWWSLYILCQGYANTKSIFVLKTCAPWEANVSHNLEFIFLYAFVNRWMMKVYSELNCWCVGNWCRRRSNNRNKLHASGGTWIVWGGLLKGSIVIEFDNSLMFSKCFMFRHMCVCSFPRYV